MSQIEFLKDSHTYLLDGVIVKSVTQILTETLFVNQYASVPKKTLDSAREFGVNVHEAIENDSDEGLTFTEGEAFKQFKRLQRMNRIHIIDHEHIVHYKSFYAGTMDAIARVDGKLALLDYKTTYSLNEDYVKWQLNLYRLAFEWATGDTVKELYCLWLPKGRAGSMVRIGMINDKQLKKLVGEEVAYGKHY